MPLSPSCDLDEPPSRGLSGSQHPPPVFRCCIVLWWSCVPCFLSVFAARERRSTRALCLLGPGTHWVAATSCQCAGSLKPRKRAGDCGRRRLRWRWGRPNRKSRKSEPWYMECVKLLYRVLLRMWGSPGIFLPGPSSHLPGELLLKSFRASTLAANAFARQ